MERKAAGDAERGERTAGPRETRKWTSGLCSAGSGGWRGEPATGNKGSEGEKPLRLAPPKTEIAVKCFPRKRAERPGWQLLGGETGGSANAGRGPRRRLSGKIPLPFPATSASPPEAEKPSSVPPSTPGCRVRGGRQCSGAGAVTRLPSRACGLCNHKQISWGFPGRLEPRESQPPTKRKVKEKRAERNGEDKHPQRRLGEGRVAAALGRVPQVSWLRAP